MSGFTNMEGYADPTFHNAMRHITAEERRASRPPFRPLVYICSPYSGDTEGNTKRAIAFCRFALDQGNIPLAPHLMFPLFMNDEDPKERSLAIFMDIVLLGKCQEMWVLGDTITDGMQKELDVAKKRHQRIRYFNDAFKEVKPW